MDAVDPGGKGVLLEVAERLGDIKTVSGGVVEGEIEGERACWSCRP